MANRTSTTTPSTYVDLTPATSTSWCSPFWPSSITMNKLPAPPISASGAHQQTVSNRTEVRAGVWQYADEAESQYAFEMLCFAGFDLSSIDTFLEDVRLPADIRDHLLETRAESLQHYADGGFDLAVSKFETLHARCLYYGQNLAVEPKLQLVERFKGKGRGKSPIRKAIQSLLNASPSKKTAEIWSAIKDHPPHGYTVMENQVGKYIEGPKPGENMDYKRFGNVCSEERKALKGN